MFHSWPAHNVTITKAGVQIGGDAPNYEGRPGQDDFSLFIPANIIVERGITVEHCNETTRDDGRNSQPDKPKNGSRPTVELPAKNRSKNFPRC
jgi:hypothetical protein